VSLTSNKTSPQAVGTPIVWTAAPTGGVAPYQYLWWVFDGSTWTQMGTWNAANTFTWTPSTAGTNYRIAVWLRSNGNASDHEAANEAYFTVTAGQGASTPAPAPAPVPAPNAPPVTAVTLSADRISPQAANTTINWTASASGGVSPVYQFWVFDGVNWTSQPWSSSNKFAWTPTAASSNSRVAVWVKSAGAADTQATSEAWFTITGPLTSAGPVTSVKLSANLAAPQSVNTAITWTATATGGFAPLQYQWWIFDGVNWTSGSWTTSNKFTWTPSAANPNYRIAVWVRGANKRNGYESSTEAWFAITE